MMPEVTWAKGHYDSIHGRIVSNWQREGSRLTMEVAIPANTSATVHVPAKSVEAVTESGKPAGQSTDMRFLRFEKGVATFEVGGGSYQFQSILPDDSY
jgi:alpha-L-rhamnosidase